MFSSLTKFASVIHLNILQIASQSSSWEDALSALQGENNQEDACIICEKIIDFVEVKIPETHQAMMETSKKQESEDLTRFTDNYDLEVEHCMEKLSEAMKRQKEHDRKAIKKSSQSGGSEGL